MKNTPRHRPVAGPIHESAPLACNKIRFETIVAAADGAPMNQVPYRCKLCSAWHLTKNGVR